MRLRLASTRRKAENEKHSSQIAGHVRFSGSASPDDVMTFTGRVRRKPPPGRKAGIVAGKDLFSAHLSPLNQDANT